LVHHPPSLRIFIWTDFAGLASKYSQAEAWHKEGKQYSMCQNASMWFENNSQLDYFFVNLCCCIINTTLFCIKINWIFIFLAEFKLPSFVFKKCLSITGKCNICTGEYNLTFKGNVLVRMKTAHRKGIYSFRRACVILDAQRAILWNQK